MAERLADTILRRERETVARRRWLDERAAEKARQAAAAREQAAGDALRAHLVEANTHWIDLQKENHA